MLYIDFVVEIVTRRDTQPERKGAIEQNDIFLSTVKEESPR